MKRSTGLEAALYTILLGAVGAYLGSLLGLPEAGAVVFAIAAMGGYLVDAINGSK